MLTNPYSELYLSFLHLFLRGSFIGPYPVLQTLPLLTELFPELLGEVPYLRCTAGSWSKVCPGAQCLLP